LAETSDWFYKGKPYKTREAYPSLNIAVSAHLPPCHYELLFECPPEEIELLAPKIKHCMENAEKLSVSLDVDVKTGPNWGAARRWK
jgi:DNA polymerase family A